MKAIVCTRYGPPDVLSLEEVAKPAPRADGILIKVEAASVNRSDWEGLTGTPLYARMGGLRRPRRPILGSDIAGRVEAAGSQHTRFKPGEAVFGDILGHNGGFAEYVCVRGRSLARIPAGMTFETAAALPQAAVIALQGLRDKGRVRPGQAVLINGAGGGAGSFAVQLAKRYGAEVTGVDHTHKLDFMRTAGADHVVDYTRSDFTRGGRRYDLILDVIACRPIFAYPRALKPGGSYYFVGGETAIIFQALLLGGLIRRATGKRVGLLAVQPNPRDLEHVAGLCQAGEIKVFVDRTYPLSAVPEALKYLGEGGAKGKVVIRMDGGKH